MNNRVIDGGQLTLSDVVAIADGAKVEMTKGAVQRMQEGRKRLEAKLETGANIYGVNTGFGPLKSEIIGAADQIDLQRNLIRSHAVGVGPPLEKREVRAAMALLAACHARGRSGVGPEASLLICELLNKDLIPYVPSQGSLGASGDLAPLAHIALALIGEGKTIEGNAFSDALSKNQINELSLTSKLGISLINGTHVHTALACLILNEANLLAKIADIACAMSAEAMLCSLQPFRNAVHFLRPHPHQILSAKNLTLLMQDSEISLSHQNCGEVQDAYSIRCAPQVHGASRQAFAHANEVFDIEISSVTDNPLVIEDEVISAGHFHGQPNALAIDYMKLGLAELANISERRTERILNKDYNRGLPAFLVHKPGLHSGMMICQYTAASLVSENKVLSHPSSSDSIPTGANQEDHVSMGMNAAIHAKRVLQNSRTVLAIELLAGAQGMDCRKEIQSDNPAPGVAAAWKAVRVQSPILAEDRSLSEEIQSLNLNLILEEVESQVGALS